MPGTLWPKIMLTGKNGQVGWELQRTLAPLGEVAALDRRQLDLANPDQIRESVREIKPDLIPTGKYPAPASRPAYSLLSNAKLNRAYGLAMLDWDRALELVLEECA